MQKIFETINENANKNFILVCEHAGGQMPMDLGLSPDQMKSDIVCDWGAGDVTRELAKILKCTAVLATLSRLVVDLNRYPNHPESVPAKSQRGTKIPGNQISKSQIKKRHEEFFWPFHHQLRDQMARLQFIHEQITLIDIHSFSPEYNGEKRPWQVGVLFDQNEKISKKLIASLRKAGLKVGANEPYTAKDEVGFGFTTNAHAVDHHLPHLMIELRQDEIDTPAKVQKMAKILAKALGDLLSA